jgi:hypothetical protein
MAIIKITEIATARNESVRTVRVPYAESGNGLGHKCAVVLCRGDPVHPAMITRRFDAKFSETDLSGFSLITVARLHVENRHARAISFG